MHVNYQADIKHNWIIFSSEENGKNSVRDVEARNSFSSIGSDHRIVTAKIRLSLRTHTVQKKTRDEWNKLKLDTDLQERYTVEIRNNMPLLSLDDDSCDKTVNYSHLIQANKEAAGKVMPKVHKKQRRALFYE